MIRRKVLSVGVALGILPAAALAQIGCPSKCKVDSKGRCCRITYKLAAGQCFRDDKDCSSSAARGCNYCR